MLQDGIVKKVSICYIHKPHCDCQEEKLCLNKKEIKEPILNLKLLIT